MELDYWAEKATGGYILNVVLDTKQLGGRPKNT